METTRKLSQVTGEDRKKQKKKTRKTRNKEGRWREEENVNANRAKGEKGTEEGNTNEREDGWGRKRGETKVIKRLRGKDKRRNRGRG